ncbi:unnamed protein product [Taenia asiatica]|uniref:Diagnostic antigen gp50 n=1 Tax=Taenia asiatica TaxID=60517 RepID=A0A0R3VWR4_TAEAS|nr:unnamed protein product [Taenia asiatica]
MLNIITVLLCAVYCTGETSPKLWGSRVISKSSGPSDTMSYRISGETNIAVYTATKVAMLSFDNGSCMVGNEYWGSPCQKGKDTVNITVKDVNMQTYIEIHSGLRDDAYTLSTYFAPNCKFPPLATVELEKDKASDLRVFHGVFTPRSDVQWERFTWSMFTSELAISVDYTQSGISPEVAEYSLPAPTTSSGKRIFHYTEN